jgi:hypothetical protein
VAQKHRFEVILRHGRYPSPLSQVLVQARSGLKVDARRAERPFQPNENPYLSMGRTDICCVRGFCKE